LAKSTHIFDIFLHLLLKY